MRGRFFVTVSALLPIGADTRQKKRLLRRPSRAIVRKIGSTAAGHDPPEAVSPDAFSSRIIARLFFSTSSDVGLGMTPETRLAPGASTTPVGRPLASRLIHGSVILSRPIASTARLFRYVS